jgi:hypothetical protein
MALTRASRRALGIPIIATYSAAANAALDQTSDFSR